MALVDRLTAEIAKKLGLTAMPTDEQLLAELQRFYEMYYYDYQTPTPANPTGAAAATTASPASATGVVYRPRRRGPGHRA